MASTFRLRLSGTCLNLTSPIKLLIDRWCSMSKSVNHISGDGLKCISWSMISTCKSKCVAKFRFASVWYFKLSRSTTKFEWFLFKVSFWDSVLARSNMYNFTKNWQNYIVQRCQLPKFFSWEFSNFCNFQNSHLWSGNVATEDLLYMLHGMGIETGVSIDAVVDAAKFICAKLNHGSVHSKVAKAWNTCSDVDKT